MTTNRKPVVRSKNTRNNRRNSGGPKAPSKTFIAVSRELEVSRSPVDGLWRAWYKIPRHLVDPYCPEWITVAVNRKAGEAIREAKEYIAEISA